MRSGALIAAVALWALRAGAADNKAAARGKPIYDRECSHCHGATGKGDGEESAYLTPSPKDFTAGILDERSDDFLARVIAKGGEAEGLSKAMPATPKLSQAEVKDVVAYIRQLGKGAAKAK
jgi:mono/diheme cytochrome c family protein